MAWRLRGSHVLGILSLRDCYDAGHQSPLAMTKSRLFFLELLTRQFRNARAVVRGNNCEHPEIFSGHCEMPSGFGGIHPWIGTHPPLHLVTLQPGEYYNPYLYPAVLGLSCSGTMITSPRSTSASAALTCCHAFREERATLRFDSPTLNAAFSAGRLILKVQQNIGKGPCKLSLETRLRPFFCIYRSSDRQAKVSPVHLERLMQEPKAI